MSENQKRSHLVSIVGIAGIVACWVVNAFTMKVDSIFLSGVIGGIVFIVTRKLYKP